MDSRYLFYKEEDVLAVLLQKNRPVMEASLIRALSKEFRYPALADSSLFNIHFSLFNCLYRIKKTDKYSNIYIHFDPMRLHAIHFPHEGCRHYLAKYSSFCRVDTDTSYCEVHERCNSNKLPVSDAVASFYLDASNITFQDIVDVYEGMDRAMYYGLNKTKVDEALAFFNTGVTSAKHLKRRYREIALRLHPDRGGSADKMKELNQHYDVLCHVFIS